jgi:hypothetical protein
MDYKEHANKILRDWALCSTARPRNNAIDIQIEKDTCGRWAVHLMHVVNWGSDLEIVEACYQLESRLNPLKEKIVIEVLTNGFV